MRIFWCQESGSQQGTSLSSLYASPAGSACGQAQNGCVTEKLQPTAASPSPVTMGAWEQEGCQLHASARAAPAPISQGPFPQWAAEIWDRQGGKYSWGSLKATQGLLGRTSVFPFAVGSPSGAIWRTEPGFNPPWKVCLKPQNNCFSSMSNPPFLDHTLLTVVLECANWRLDSSFPT